MLADILKEFREDGKKPHRIAADLVEIADRHGISPTGAAKYPDLLKAKKLKPADITSEVLGVAGAIERMDASQTRLQVERINAIGKAKPKASPVVKTLHRVLTAAKASLTERGAFKVRKQLAEEGIDMEDVTSDLLAKVQTYHDQLMGTK